jgi:tetratricopeptide (TPR) repeat protein
MNRKIVHLSIFIWVMGLMTSTNVLAQGQADNWFDQGNQLYKNQQYKEAIMRWEAVLESGAHSGALYFNMANAYYYLNDLASSMYYYEKALALNPNDEDIKANRAYVQNALIDVIREQPKTLFQKWDEASGQLFSVATWAWLGLLFMALFVFAVLRFGFVDSPGAKRFSFVLAMMCLMLFVAVIFLGRKTEAYHQNYRWAIVFQQEMSVRSGPRLSDDALFELHAGTKLRLLQSQDQWQEIELADGRRGWVLAQELKAL